MPGKQRGLHRSQSVCLVDAYSEKDWTFDDNRSQDDTRMERSSQKDSRRSRRRLSSLADGVRFLRRQLTGSQLTLAERRLQRPRRSVCSLQQSSGGRPSYRHTDRGSLLSDTSASSDDSDWQPYRGPRVGRARARVHYQPSPYDRDALPFRCGDIIDIISKSPSGLWRGALAGRVGTFKFINVEVLEEVGAAEHAESPLRGRPASVRDLLEQLGLSGYLCVFSLHGFDRVEDFVGLQSDQLCELGMDDADHRRLLLAAARALEVIGSDSADDLEEEDTCCDYSQPLLSELIRDTECFDLWKLSDVLDSQNVDDSVFPKHELSREPSRSAAHPDLRSSGSRPPGQPRPTSTDQQVTPAAYEQREAHVAEGTSVDVSKELIGSMPSDAVAKTPADCRPLAASEVSAACIRPELPGFGQSTMESDQSAGESGQATMVPGDSTVKPAQTVVPCEPEAEPGKCPVMSQSTVTPDKHLKLELSKEGPEQIPEYDYLPVRSGQSSVSDTSQVATEHSHEVEQSPALPVQSVSGRSSATPERSPECGTVSHPSGCSASAVLPSSDTVHLCESTAREIVKDEKHSEPAVTQTKPPDSPSITLLPHENTKPMAEVHTPISCDSSKMNGAPCYALCEEMSAPANAASRNSLPVETNRCSVADFNDFLADEPIGYSTREQTSSSVKSDGARSVKSEAGPSREGISIVSWNKLDSSSVNATPSSEKKNDVSTIEEVHSQSEKVHDAWSIISSGGSSVKLIVASLGKTGCVTPVKPCVPSQPDVHHAARVATEVTPSMALVPARSVNPNVRLSSEATSYPLVDTGTASSKTSSTTPSVKAIVATFGIKNVTSPVKIRKVSVVKDNLTTPLAFGAFHVVNMQAKRPPSPDIEAVSSEKTEAVHSANNNAPSVKTKKVTSLQTNTLPRVKGGGISMVSMDTDPCVKTRDAPLIMASVSPWAKMNVSSHGDIAALPSVGTISVPAVNASTSTSVKASAVALEVGGRGCSERTNHPCSVNAHVAHLLEGGVDRAIANNTDLAVDKTGSSVVDATMETYVEKTAAASHAPSDPASPLHTIKVRTAAVNGKGVRFVLRTSSPDRQGSLESERAFHAARSVFEASCR